MFGVAITTAYALVYVVALFAQWRSTSRIAVWVPVILVVAMTASKAHPGTTFNAAVIVALVAWATWRFGFLAGVMTVWLPDMIDSAWTLMRAPGGETMTAGVISLLIAFIPLVVVLMARRRVLEVPSVTEVRQTS